MNIFNLSYVALWTLVALQTYYIVKINEKKTTQIPGIYDDRSLIREDDGFPKGEKFPILQFQSVNKGFVDLTKISEKNIIIALTALGCDNCNALYPILEKYHKEQNDVITIILTLGNRDELLENVEKLGLTMPVAPIQLDEVDILKTKFFPFVYYVDSSLEIKVKSVILNEKQFKYYLQKGKAA